MSSNVIMPQLGESVVEGTVSRWLKQVGDTVQEFEPLVEISTDKVETEIPSPATGVVLAIYVPEGTTVERGALLAIIGQPGEQPPESSQLAQQTASAPEPSHVNGEGHPTKLVFRGDPGEKVEEPQAAPRYSPVVMRMAAEHRIDLAHIKGTGMAGRVTKKDVEAYLALRSKTPEAAPWEQPVGSGDLFKPTDEVFKKASEAVAQPSPPPDSSEKKPDIPGELIPLSNIRRLIAEHMVTSKLHTAPHVTTVFEVDMSRVMAHWKANEEPFARQGLRLTLTAYFVMAIAQAAQAHPTLNSRWTDRGLFVYHAVNVGVAVALQDGLIVPVIKNAQDLNLSGVARQVNDLATRARAKALVPDEISGGTITLTNHGVSGSLLATPIINQPQSAIVGVGAVQKRVVVIESGGGDSIAIRPMMYATLTFDHRVADGAVADAFLATFKKALENWS